jgi:hypothetical protein
VVSLHRRQLPIASPCERFEGTEATADRAAFCTRCDKHVHDLSRLTEPEVVDLLARHLGREVCVSYRARPDGTIALRKPASRVAPAAMALALAGCAGHLTDADTRASDCVDAQGYDIECPPDPRLGMAVIPEQTDAPDPAHVAAELESDDLDPAYLESIDAVRGGISGVVIEAEVPTVPEPGPVPSVYEGDSEMMGKMITVDRPLSRKVERQAKRIERRERREARALAKR